MELLQYKYDLLKKCAIECQETIHFMSNIYNKDRHLGKMQNCTEQSCQLFIKMIADVDRIDETYKRSFPDLVGVPSKQYNKDKK